MYGKRAFAALLAVLLGLTPVAAAASSGGFGVHVSQADDLIDGLPDDVQHYSNQPGWVVHYRDSKSVNGFDALKSWANASDARRIVEHHPMSNTVVLSSPAPAVNPGLLQEINPLDGIGDGLVGKSYVVDVNVDTQTGIVEPVTLKRQGQASTPAGWLGAVTPGSFDQSTVAYRNDTEKSSLADVRQMIEDDGVSAEGAGVTLAVIDDGTTTANGTLYQNRVVAAKNTITGGTGVENVTSSSGHGSWVASAIAADPKPSIEGEKREGIAHEANLILVKALNQNGGSASDVAQGIRYAERHGADIISMSLGSQMYSAEICRAMQDALNGNVTAIYVAAGNNRMTTRYVTSPADCPISEGVIAVAATNVSAPKNASPAYFSAVGEDPGTLDFSYGKTRGETVDVAAPGMRITAPVATEDGTVENHTLSGTSMATPIAAGHGAVLLSTTDLENDSEKFEERIYSTSQRVPNGGVTEVGHGVPSSVQSINNNTTERSQKEVRTPAAQARDAANRGLAARFNTYGVDLLARFFQSAL